MRHGRHGCLRRGARRRRERAHARRTRQLRARGVRARGRRGPRARGGGGMRRRLERAGTAAPMSIVQDDLANVDVASPRIYAEGVPHETLAALRKHDPVHWHPWPGTRGGFWLLSRHEDVVAAGRDPELFSSQVGHIALEDREPDALAARQSLIETDPPEHTRLRK